MLNKAQMDFIIEFWKYIRARKKFWLLPIVIVLTLFGFMIVLGEGSVVTPFIYAIF